MVIGDSGQSDLIGSKPRGIEYEHECQDRP